MDTFLKTMPQIRFKRTVDKKKINYVSPDHGISYAILPLYDDSKQHFGWYYLYNKETKNWYRKTDYFVETLTAIAQTDPQSAEFIFDAINECTACIGNPCSAIPYEFNGIQKSACYGRIIMGLDHNEFNHVKSFFKSLYKLLDNS